MIPRACQAFVDPPRGPCRAPATLLYLAECPMNGDLHVLGRCYEHEIPLGTTLVHHGMLYRLREVSPEEATLHEVHRP